MTEGERREWFVSYRLRFYGTISQRAQNLLELLLGAEVSGVAALALTAVLGTEGETGIASTANHLFAVGLTGQSGEGRLDHTTTKTEHQVEGRLLLNVVVRKRAAILELLSGEDETLLVRGDTWKRQGNEGSAFGAHTAHWWMECSIAKCSHNTCTFSQRMSLRNSIRTFLILDLGLDLLDRVTRLDLEGDGLSRESLDEDLHPTEKQNVSKTNKANKGRK